MTRPQAWQTTWTCSSSASRNDAGAVAEVGVAQQAEFFEQLDRAVDRGQVDVGDGRADLFRRRVLEGAHRVEHLLALRRHPQAALVQALRRGRPRRRSARPDTDPRMLGAADSAI